MMRSVFSMLIGFLAVCLTPSAFACDGKEASAYIAVGKSHSFAGNLRIIFLGGKFDKDLPDEYFITVIDEGTVLAKRAAFKQYETLEFKTRCGTLVVGSGTRSGEMVSFNITFY